MESVTYRKSKIKGMNDLCNIQVWGWLREFVTFSLAFFDSEVCSRMKDHFFLTNCDISDSDLEHFLTLLLQ